MSGAHHSGSGGCGGSFSKSQQRFGPYQVGDTIGRGTFAKVKIGYHESTKVRVALKIISRKVMDSDAHSALKISREIKIMRVLRHPHITRLYDVVKTKHDIVIVMEYVSGGELFDYISRKGRLDEPTSRSLFQQLTAAVAYCHRYRVTHRDIKPENIMMEHGSHSVKLSDFGLSSITHDGRFFETSCGTPNYASPEVVGGRLYGGPEADVWSCGVVLYAMLCGVLPFDDTNIGVLFKKIQTADYAMPGHVSQQAQDLMRRMLVVNPLERATIEQVMQHPWLRPHFPRYLLSLHYETVVDTTRFARTYYLTEDMLDEEVVNVVASRFHISPPEVAMIVMAEEEKVPSMRAVISEDENNHLTTRRYPAAVFFEMYANVLDSKLWPTPVEILPAEAALRDEAHDVYVSYSILTQKKQNKLAPQEYASNTSFGSNASSFLQSQAQQGYGSLNANSLHQLSGNSSMTGNNLREAPLRARASASPSNSKKPKGQTEKMPQNVSQQSTLDATLPVTFPGDPWQAGYNRVAAPFLPLHVKHSTHTIMGNLLRVQELPVQLLMSRSLTVKPVSRELNNTLTPTSQFSATYKCRGEVPPFPQTIPTTQCVLLQPQRSPSTKSNTPGDSALLLPQSPGDLIRGSPIFSPTTAASVAAASSTGVIESNIQHRHSSTAANETALETLYQTEVVTRFGNDFIRNGVAFVGCTPQETLRDVYGAMKEEGLLWKVIYDYYFSAVRYPNIKLQVKVYKVKADEQIVDVKVSLQSGMSAFDVAIGLLERLRTRAVLRRNNSIHKKSSSLFHALKSTASMQSVSSLKGKGP
ncbi:putative protein kinase [Leptomonas seymouri]|uniref:Protein kinase domain-containing protein n=1 Tax=Leptomonas seymouri TaxID=5684 RepID=A0A0N0P7V2_LEPSE|nr:putative protein kinase [Leptomonas seymouri]|eukprot:KPI89219.1 putative protein kinase [Leptomonas seymouri]